MCQTIGVSLSHDLFSFHRQMQNQSSAISLHSNRYFQSPRTGADDLNRNFILETKQVLCCLLGLCRTQTNCLHVFNVALCRLNILPDMKKRSLGNSVERSFIDLIFQNLGWEAVSSSQYSLEAKINNGFWRQAWGGSYYHFSWYTWKYMYTGVYVWR